MTKQITVCIYTYKGKQIKDVLTSLFSNANDVSKINVLLIDQNPIDRKKALANEFDINYIHVFWDSLYGPCFHKSVAINNSESEYFMLLGENSILYKDWDINFINFLENKNAVLSDNKKIKIKSKNIFYIEKEYEESNNFELNNFISRDFIFAKTETIKKINYPDYLKYNGEEESLSLQFFTEGIDIYSIPTNMLHCNQDKPITNTYTPFSLNHEYNEIVALFKFGQNKYINIKNKNRTLLDFSKYHNFDFTSLCYLPFQTNDISYDPDQLNFNQIDARKFVARTKAIH
jgi:hypothetical protein